MEQFPTVSVHTSAFSLRERERGGGGGGGIKLRLILGIIARSICCLYMYVDVQIERSV